MQAVANKPLHTIAERRRRRQASVSIVAAVFVMVILAAERYDSQTRLNAMLVEAIQRSDPVAVGKLLNRGASPNAGKIEMRISPVSNLRGVLDNAMAYFNPDYRPSSALMLACERKGSASIVAILLRHGADPRYAGPYHLTALSYAAFYGDSASVQRLLSGGVPLDGRVPDMLEAGLSSFLSGRWSDGDHDYTGAIKALAGHGMSLNEPVSGPTSVLDAACAYGRDDLVHECLKLGANPRIRDCTHRNAFDYARLAGRKDVLAILSRPPSPPAPLPQGVQLR